MGSTINSRVAGIDQSMWLDFGWPQTRVLAPATDYQALDPTRPAIISITCKATSNLTLLVGQTASIELSIGPAALTCGGAGLLLATWTNGNTGALTIGINTNQTIGSPFGFLLPVGGHFILCVTSGGPYTITAVDQVVMLEPLQ